jgi:hypothetical protein
LHTATTTADLGAMPVRPTASAQLYLRILAASTPTPGALDVRPPVRASAPFVQQRQQSASNMRVTTYTNASPSSLERKGRRTRERKAARVLVQQ